MRRRGYPRYGNIFMPDDNNFKVMYSPINNEYYMKIRGESLIHCLKCGPSEIEDVISEPSSTGLIQEMADLVLRYRVTESALPDDVRTAATDAAYMVISGIHLIHQVPAAVLSILRLKN